MVYSFIFLPTPLGLAKSYFNGDLFLLRDTYFIPQAWYLTLFEIELSRFAGCSPTPSLRPYDISFRNDVEYSPLSDTLHSIEVQDLCQERFVDQETQLLIKKEKLKPVACVHSSSKRRWSPINIRCSLTLMCLPGNRTRPVSLIEWASSKSQRALTLHHRGQTQGQAI
jgi:hypothetical protein